MEKLPSKPVIEAVEKSSDGKVIASGMFSSFFFFCEESVLVSPIGICLVLSRCRRRGWC
jgi:hypothetical protein